jgi:hypothetical protein
MFAPGDPHVSVHLAVSALAAHSQNGTNAGSRQRVNATYRSCADVNLAWGLGIGMLVVAVLRSCQRVNATYRSCADVNLARMLVPDASDGASMFVSAHEQHVALMCGREPGARLGIGMLGFRSNVRVSA